MHDDELHRFKSDIHLVQYAVDRYGYQRDRRESSVSSHVLRHLATDDKIVVRKDQDGHWTYFSIRDDREHGTIVDFVQRRGRHPSLGSVRQELRQWLGTSRPAPNYERPLRAPAGARDSRSVAEAFAAARVVEASAYLRGRGLHPETLRDPRFAGTWRQDARGNMLFVHRDEAGAITGFEVKNRAFHGFAPGGTKTAWQSAPLAHDRVLIVTESAIDALSYHQLHGQQDARYLSTAGAPSPRQVQLLGHAIGQMAPASRIVAASKVRRLSRTGGYVTASGPAARLDRRKGLRPATHPEHPAQQIRTKTSTSSTRPPRRPRSRTCPLVSLQAPSLNLGPPLVALRSNRYGEKVADAS